MEKKTTYKRILGSITILAGIISAACILLGAIAVDYNFDAFSDPALVFHYAHNYSIAYWFLLLDMTGYYLLLLPVIFYLHQQYKYQSPWVQLFTFSGLAYVLTGAIGAAMLASVWPQLMQQYNGTSAVDKPSVELVFNVITQLVTKGLWNILEVLFAACWWIGFGAMLRRDHKLIGVLSLVAGFACLTDAIGTIAGWKIVSETGVNIYILLGIIWPMVVGVHIMRKPVSHPPMIAGSTSSSTINKGSYAEA